MTRENAYKMWHRCFTGIRQSTPPARVIINPAFEFAKDVMAGKYNNMSDEEFDILKTDMEQESAFYGDKPSASSYLVMVAAIRSVTFTQNSYDELLSLLADITSGTYQEHFSEDIWDDPDISDCPFA